SYPGAPGFTSIKTLRKVCSRTEHGDRCSFDTRFYISSSPLDIERIAAAARGHWGVESMHWLLDVAFKEDLSRYRTGHGAKNMAVVRRSRSIWCAPTKPNGASKPAVNAPVAARNFCGRSFRSDERYAGFRAVAFMPVRRRFCVLKGRMLNVARAGWEGVRLACHPGNVAKIMMRSISVIIPVYNESDNLDAMYQALA